MKRIAVTIALAAVALLLVGVALLWFHRHLNDDDCQTEKFWRDDYCGLDR